MHRLIPWTGWAALAMVLGGCAWVPQKATLQLDPRIDPSTLGNATTVFVKVTDRRPSEILGRRGLDSKNAAITTSQNVTRIFEDETRDGLDRKGFKVISDPETAERILNVEIQEISYKTDMEFWQGQVMARTVLRVSSRHEGSHFDRVYVGERHETAIEAPSARTNQRLINQSLSEALEKMFQDERLMQFLAR